MKGGTTEEKTQRVTGLYDALHEADEFLKAQKDFGGSRESEQPEEKQKKDKSPRSDLKCSIHIPIV